MSTKKENEEVHVAIAAAKAHVRHNAIHIITAIQNFAVYTLSAWVMTVSMNLEYKLHVQAPALRDLGFELLFEMPSQFGHLTEYMLHSVTVFCVCGALVDYKVPHSWRDVCPRWDFVSAWLRCMSVLNVLRVASFLVTQLPGPAEHCRPGSLTYNPPDTVFERANFEKGCGDLLFSGHTMLLTTSLMILHEVNRNRPFVRLCLWLYLLVFCVLVVAMRKHYTVDVLVALYTAPLVYNRFRTGWHLNEMIAPAVQNHADVQWRQVKVEQAEEAEAFESAKDCSGACEAPVKKVPTSTKIAAASMIALSAWLWLHITAPLFRNFCSLPVLRGLALVPTFLATLV